MCKRMLANTHAHTHIHGTLCTYLCGLYSVALKLYWRPSQMADRSITIYSANGPMLAIKFNLYAGGKAATLLPAHPFCPLPHRTVFAKHLIPFSITVKMQQQLQGLLAGPRARSPEDRIHHMGHRLPAGLSAWLAY